MAPHPGDGGHALSIFSFLAVFIGLVPALVFPDPLQRIPDPLLSVPCNQDDYSRKQIDIVLYGATGFTGQLAVRYLAAGHPESPRWVMAGRDREKLNYVHYKFCTNKSTPPANVIYAPTQDEQKMDELAKMGRVILNFAAPFEKSGADTLVRAAMKNCAHYVDISTETDWKSSILRQYGPIAEARGLAIVQSAGFAATASDLLAMSAMADVVKIENEVPKQVFVVWSKFNDAMSSGQGSTIQDVMLNRVSLTDTYILAPKVSEDQKVDWKIDGMEEYGYNDEMHKELEEYTFSGIDSPVIHRSIFMKYPNATVSVQIAADHRLTLERMRFAQDPNMNFENAPVQKDYVPSEGLPAWVLNHGSFAAEAFSTGKSMKAHVKLEGNGDPSFMGSAKMATEMALGLARGPASGFGGYLTPSTALGLQNLEQRLTQVDNGQFITITHVRKDVI